MESMNEVMEVAPVNKGFEAQRFVAEEYRTLLSGINKSAVLEHGYN